MSNLCDEVADDLGMGDIHYTECGHAKPNSGNCRFPQGDKRENIFPNSRNC